MARLLLDGCFLPDNFKVFFLVLFLSSRLLYSWAKPNGLCFFLQRFCRQSLGNIKAWDLEAAISFYIKK